MSARNAATAAAAETFKGDREEPSTDPFLRRLMKDPLITLANSRLLLALTLVVILGMGTISQMVLEKSSFGDGLWWAVVTASTVGYGDISPHTASGRIVAGVMIGMMVLLLVPLITAQILSRLVRDDNAFTHNEQEKLKADVALLCEKLEATHDKLNVTQEDVRAIRKLLEEKE